MRSSRPPRCHSIERSRRQRAAHRPPQAAEEEARPGRAPPVRRAACRVQRSSHSGTGIVVFPFSPGCIARSSLATQCQALKQPSTRPATSSARVQECGPGGGRRANAQRRAEQGRHHDRPADQAHHAQPEPHARARHGAVPRACAVPSRRPAWPSGAWLSASTGSATRSLAYPFGLRPAAFLLPAHDDTFCSWAKRATKPVSEPVHHRAQAARLLVLRRGTRAPRRRAGRPGRCRAWRAAPTRAPRRRSSPARLHRRRRRLRHRPRSRSSGCRASALRRSPAGAAAGRTSRRPVSATMRDTSALSRKTRNGSSTSRFMAAGAAAFAGARRRVVTTTGGALGLADGPDHVQRAFRTVLELVAQDALAAVERVVQR